MSFGKDLQNLCGEGAVLTSCDDSYEQYMQRWSDIEKVSLAAIVLPKTEEECQDLVSRLL